MAADCLGWWAGLLVLGVGFVPVVERIVPEDVPDRGRALAKPLALVTLCYLAWLLTSAGLAHRTALVVAGLAFIVISGGAWIRRPQAPWLRSWLAGEAFFASALLAFALVRALDPAIFGAEKYMDFAIFNTLIRAEHYPPEDPWMTGAALNYYYFGYLMFADLARLTGAAPPVAYNLALATVGAIVASVAVSIGRLLGGGIAGGVLAVVATVGMGNLDGARQLLLAGRTIDSFDYWGPTRVVPHTINEFPFFSLLHGDLHPHVTALVIDVTLIGVALALARAARRPAAEPERAAVPIGLAVIALLLGAIAITNPWDVPIQLTLLGLLTLSAIWDDARPVRSMLRIGGWMIAAVLALVVLSLPFTRHFAAQGHGIGQVHERTAIVPFLLVFGVLVPPGAIHLLREARDDLPAETQLRDLLLALAILAAIVLYLASQSLVLIITAMSALMGLSTLLGSGARIGDLSVALATAGFVAIATGELLFLRDPYGDEMHRMNTIFKLYFQAWLLLALALPGILRSLAERGGTMLPRLVTGAVMLGVAASLCYPVAVITQRYRHADPGWSLDGVRYLARQHADDAEAIRWLAAEASGTPAVLEASGDPYSYFARVSANTGLPTLLGWANHESVWRGADPRIAQRGRDVARLYTDPDIAATRALLARYRIHYVFVGELERQLFDAAALAKFPAHPETFTSVYRAGGTEIFAVRATTDSE